MAGEIQLNSTTFATESGGTITVSNVDSATNRTNLGLGSSDTASFQSLTINGVTNQGFPSGTKMLFQQTAAPTGWTKDTGSNDVALRVVSGTVGSGGTVAFETAFASQTVPTHTLTTSELPSLNHYHALKIRGGSGASGPVNQPTLNGTLSYDATIYEYDGSTVVSFTGSNKQTYADPGNSGGADAHGHGSINLDVSYVDVIIATKD